MTRIHTSLLALAALLCAAGLPFIARSTLAQPAAPADKGAAPVLTGHLALLDCTAVDRSTCRSLGEAFEARAEAAAALVQWLKAQGADQPERARKAAQALVLLGTAEDAPALRAAAERLADQPALRVEMLASAARLGDRSAAEPLLAALDVQDERSRVVAMTALGLLKEARARDKLVMALQPKVSGRVQAAAAQALGLIGDDKALVPLLTLAARPNCYAPARIQALDALAALGARVAVPLATQLIDHPERSVGRAALRLLIAMPTLYAQPAVAFGLQTPGLRAEAARAAVALKADKLGPLVLKAAIDPGLQPDERTWVLHALGVFDPPGAATALLDRFADADKSSRIELLKALPSIGDRTVVPRLVPLLRVQDREVANYVVYALENLTGKRFGGDEQAWREHTGLDKPAP